MPRAIAHGRRDGGSHLVKNPQDGWGAPTGVVAKGGEEVRCVVEACRQFALCEPRGARFRNRIIRRDFRRRWGQDTRENGVCEQQVKEPEPEQEQEALQAGAGGEKNAGE